LAAHLKCQEGKVTLAVHEGLLGRFTARFEGIEVIREPGLQKCVMAFVGTTRAVLVKSSLQGLAAPAVSEAAGQQPNPVAELCFFNSSMVKLQATNVTNNAMQGLWVADTADVTLDASRVAGNQGNHSGAGMSVWVVKGADHRKQQCGRQYCYNCCGGGAALSDNASLTVSRGSTIVNNTSHDAAAGGGGVLLMDNSSLVLRGGSGIVNNTSLHTGGAGVAAWGKASVHIEEGSYVSGNQAMDGSCAGLAVRDNVSLFVSGARVSSNTAQRDGGGICAFGSSAITLTAGSQVVGNVAVEGDRGGIALVDIARGDVSNATIANNTAVGHSVGFQ
jgi:hypothetical protein